MKYTIPGWTDEDCTKVTNLFTDFEGKYTLLLLAVLALEGERNFGYLKRNLHPISAKTLSERLTQLQKKNLITKRVQTEGKTKKSYYSLSRGQKEFLHIMKAFRDFPS